MVEPTDLVVKSLETQRDVNRDSAADRENVIKIIISLEAAPRGPYRVLTDDSHANCRKPSALD